MKKQALLFFALSVAAFGQGVRYDVPPILNSRAVLVPNANISLCPGTATITNSTCSPASTQAFTDITLTTPCATGSPVVLPQTNVCSGVADALGNAGFWLAPGAYIYCINGPTITGKCYNLTVPTGSTVTGGTTTSQINHKRFIDGVTYPATGAGFQQAISDCNGDALCPGVDTGILGSVTTSTTTALGFGKVLWVMPGTTITGTSDPVFSYPTGGTTIIGSSNDLANGFVSSFRTTVAGSRVIAPATPGSNSNSLYITGMDLWNAAVSSTAAVLDMTNTSNSRIIASQIQRSSITGTVPNVLVKTTGSGSAFSNDFIAVSIQGPGEAYEFEGATGASSGPNENHIIGGQANIPTDCIAINLTGTVQTNNITSTQWTCESFTGTFMNVQNATRGIYMSSPRIESSVGTPTISNIANSVGIFGIIYTSPFIAGTITRGTENGKVSWYAYTQGVPGSPTEVLAVGNIQANSFTNGNSITQSLFQNSTSAIDPLAVSTDTIANANGFSIIDSHAGGHTWRLGETCVNVGHFDFRDTTQTGGPCTGFQVTGTVLAEGLFTHAITANRVWTMPDLSSGIPVSFSCGNTGSGSQTCAPAAASSKTQMYNGESTLAANAATITFPNGFTSATSYFCVANDVTTRANPVQMIPASATTATITNTTGATDVIQWICLGQ